MGKKGNKGGKYLNFDFHGEYDNASNSKLKREQIALESEFTKYSKMANTDIQVNNIQERLNYVNDLINKRKEEKLNASNEKENSKEEIILENDNEKIEETEKIEKIEESENNKTDNENEKNINSDSSEKSNTEKENDNIDESLKEENNESKDDVEKKKNRNIDKIDERSAEIARRERARKRREEILDKMSDDEFNKLYEKYEEANAKEQVEKRNEAIRHSYVKDFYKSDIFGNKEDDLLNDSQKAEVNKIIAESQKSKIDEKQKEIEIAEKEFKMQDLNLKIKKAELELIKKVAEPTVSKEEKELEANIAEMKKNMQQLESEIKELKGITEKESIKSEIDELEDEIKAFVEKDRSKDEDEKTEESDENSVSEQDKISDEKYTEVHAEFNNPDFDKILETYKNGKNKTEEEAEKASEEKVEEKDEVVEPIEKVDEVVEEESTKESEKLDEEEPVNVDEMPEEIVNFMRDKATKLYGLNLKEIQLPDELASQKLTAKKSIRERIMLMYDNLKYIKNNPEGKSRIKLIKDLFKDNSEGKKRIKLIGSIKKLNEKTIMNDIKNVKNGEEPNCKYTQNLIEKNLMSVERICEDYENSNAVEKEKIMRALEKRCIAVQTAEGKPMLDEKLQNVFTTYISRLGKISENERRNSKKEEKPLFTDEEHMI